jgi:hypothetical protein
VLLSQELDCHRYRGRDPDIQAQLPRHLCDFPSSAAGSYVRSRGLPNHGLRYNSRDLADSLLGRIWRLLSRLWGGRT